MDKMRYPRGLIRYATENGRVQRWTRKAMAARVFRPRVLVYAAVLVVISSAFIVGLASRAPLRVDVVRDRTTLSRQADDGSVENVYRLQLMNATESVQDASVSVSGMDGATVVGSPQLHLLPAQAGWLTLVVRVPEDRLQTIGPGSHPIEFAIALEHVVKRVHERSTFIIPR